MPSKYESLRGASTVRVKVVGGLGFLGSIISDMLIRRGDEVHIEDLCLWDNQGLADEIKPKSFFRRNNLVGNDTFDCVILCHHIDYPDFFNSDNKIIGTTDFIMSSLKDVKQVINVIDNKFLYKNISESKDYQKYNDYIYRNATRLLAHKNMTTIISPCLFGASLRMRWDTILNEIYLSLMTQKFCVLDFESMFCPTFLLSAVSFADYIIKKIGVENDQKYWLPYSEMRNPLEIAAILKKKLELEDDKLEINFTGSSKIIEYSPTMTYVELERITGESYDTFLSVMEKNLESNNLPDFMKDKYNNRTMLDNYCQYSSLVQSLGT